MANNNQISMEVAIEMTTRYRSNKPSNFPICESFDAAVITSLLTAEGCKFLRIYFGMNENMEAVAILVAADENGADILPDVTAEEDDWPPVVDNGIRCPPVCPPASPLNGQ